ncbi:MAG: hypothetical protein AAF602_02970 [Myxococcota bacterium]
MSFLPAAWFAAAAVASSWVVDGTSLAAVRGQEPVSTHLACPEAPPNGPRLHDRALRTLGAAVVAYSKKQGTMTWGHASLRVVYCLDEALVDAEYEAYRLSGWNERQLRDEHAGEGFAEGPWLTAQRGGLVLFRNPDPVDGGWYAEAQAANREIYEVWLDLTADELDEVTLAIESRYAAQLHDLRAREPLARRYVAWSDNCTSVFEALPARLRDDTGTPITPFALVRRLQAGGWVRGAVLYPSHHLVRRWSGELPAESRRRHPVFRRSRRLPLQLVGQLHRRFLTEAPAVASILEGNREPVRATFGIVRPSETIPPP